MPPSTRSAAIVPARAVGVPPTPIGSTWISRGPIGLGAMNSARPAQPKTGMSDGRPLQATGVPDDP